MVDGLILGEAATSALRLAAAQRPVNSPLTTGQVLAALTRVDAGNDWQRLWLHTGDPGALQLADTPDAPNVASSESWENVPLTPDMAAALSNLRQVCIAYRLTSASTGLLALALVADPNAGAARALGRSGLPHAELLEIVQEDLVGVHLEGLATLFARQPKRDDPGSLAVADSAAAILRRAELRAAGRSADELDLLAVLAADPTSGEVIERLGFDAATIEAFEKPVRSIGLTSLARLTASHPQANEDGAALRLLALLADNPSPGLSWLFRLLGVERCDVAAGALDAFETQAGRPRDPGTAVIVLGIANVVLSLVVTTLVVINAIGPGSLWELLLIPLVWLGYPRWPSAVPLLIAVPLALAVTPVSAAVQVATGLVDWLQARAERQQLIARTGVAVSTAAARRVALRRLAKGRLSLALRQIVRLRWVGPRLLRAAAQADNGEAGA
jgi:hypothetical protein